MEVSTPVRRGHSGVYSPSSRTDPPRDSIVARVSASGRKRPFPVGEKQGVGDKRQTIPSPAFSVEITARADESGRLGTRQRHASPVADAGEGVNRRPSASPLGDINDALSFIMQEMWCISHRVGSLETGRPMTA